jgi:hypothetical protein
MRKLDSRKKAKEAKTTGKEKQKKMKSSGHIMWAESGQ